jgi:hypothetical protein
MVEPQKNDLVSDFLFIFVFSLSSTEISLIANTFLTGLYWYVIVFIIFLIFSAITGKYRRRIEVITSIGLISILSLGMAQAFPLRNLLAVLLPVFPAILWGMFAWFIHVLWPSWKKKLDLKHFKSNALPIVFLFTAGVSAILVFLNSSEIMNFLDIHPWVLELVVPLATFVGGLIIGWKRKSQK